MKTRIGFYILFGLSLIGSLGCDKSNKRIELTQRLARGQSVYMNIVDDQIGLLNVNNTGYWGDVTGPSCGLSQQTFNDAAKGLMSATLPPNQIGEISSFAGTASGVRIQGGVRASFINGAISNVDLNSAQIRVAIWDTKAGTQDGDGKIIPEYPIYMVGARGAAGGNQVNLTFTDAYGTITIGGVINGGLYQGTISYQNFVHLSQYPQSSLLGCFTINVCDFFVCQ